MKYILRVFIFISALFFSAIFIQSCTIKKVIPDVKTYKIIEGKPKKNNIFEKYTQFAMSNKDSNQDIYAYLNTKYSTIIENNVVKISEKPFKELIENLTFQFRVSSDQNVSVHIYPNISSDGNLGLGGKKSRNRMYKNFVYISIIDNEGNDMLVKNTVYRNRLVQYLNSFRLLYNYDLDQKRFLQQIN